MHQFKNMYDKCKQTIAYFERIKSRKKNTHKRRHVSWVIHFQIAILNVYFKTFSRYSSANEDTLTVASLNFSPFTKKYET